MVKILILTISFLFAVNGYALNLAGYSSFRQSNSQADIDMLNLWIDGLMDGVKATNTVLEMQGLHKLFCKYDLTRDQAYNVIDNRIKNKNYKGNTQIDIVFVYGLMETYPCTEQ